MRRPDRGFSLIELLMALVIFGVLLTVGANTLSIWIWNMRVRSAAEAIQAGLQLARTEAVRRNDLIRFQMTSSLDNTCVLSTTSTNWVVSYDNPAGRCDGAFINEAFAVTDTTNNPAPRIIQTRGATEGSRDVLVAAGQSSFTFNGLGRHVFAPGITPVQIDINVSRPIINNTPEEKCADAGGKVRCLRVSVTPGGQVRMCDPKFTLSDKDSQGCY